MVEGKINMTKTITTKTTTATTLNLLLPSLFKKTKKKHLNQMIKNGFLQKNKIRENDETNKEKT